ncbi:MAG TPA: phospholipase D-like domain-containing protein [Terriglobia bacterium]|nr:phospholipase D-like domain-containing protein [Terriglobia bacterium]
MKLLIQPEHGAGSLIKEIDGAKKTIEIAIFRFDHVDIERALEGAVDRGVSVHALIANTNHGEEKSLRKLEMDLLPAGVEVSRTADDLLRHHYKFMIVDRRVLYVLTFNYTHLDVEQSRSFGLVIDDPEAVEEAARLFYADVRRQPYKPGLKSFVVSPINARQQLSHFIKGAEKQLLIYDPEISDRAMIHLLRDRAREGVEIRIIGRVVKPSDEFDAGRLMRMRFHTRAILRDRREAFLGSQSLREAELDKRRELGLIVRDRDIVHSLVKVFESDWAGLVPARQSSRKETAEGAKIVRKAVKAIVRELPLAPIVQEALEHAVGEVPNFELRVNELRHNLTDAVKEAVEDAVCGIVRKGTAAHV